MNDQFGPDYAEKQAQRLQRQRSTMPHKKWYVKYLKSIHWQDLREAKFSEVGKQCEICGSEDRIHVHHLNYRNIFDVTTGDLQVLCDSHHKKAHSIQKKPDPIKKLRAKIARMESDLEEAKESLKRLESSPKKKQGGATGQRKGIAKTAVSRAAIMNRVLDGAFDRMFR